MRPPSGFTQARDYMVQSPLLRDESNGFRHCHPCARKVTSFSRALASLRSPVYWGLVVVSIPGMAFDAL